MGCLLNGLLGWTKDDEVLALVWPEAGKGTWKSWSFWVPCSAFRRTSGACRNADSWATPEDLSLSLEVGAGTELLGESAARGAREPGS